MAQPRDEQFAAQTPLRPPQARYPPGLGGDVENPWAVQNVEGCVVEPTAKATKNVHLGLMNGRKAYVIASVIAIHVRGHGLIVTAC